MPQNLQQAQCHQQLSASGTPCSLSPAASHPLLGRGVSAELDLLCHQQHQYKP